MAMNIKEKCKMVLKKEMELLILQMEIGLMDFGNKTCYMAMLNIDLENRVIMREIIIKVRKVELVF